MKVFVNRQGKKYAAEDRKDAGDSEVMGPHPDLVAILSHPAAGARGDEEIEAGLLRYRNPETVGEASEQAELGL